MKIAESSGKELSIKDNIYRIVVNSECFNLKTFRIDKKPLVYAFIGGMWYSKGDFSLKQDISLPYPFTTYYTTKIIDKNYNGMIFRSLYYVKMPVVVLQFINECICIEFDPIIKCKDTEIIPFISLEETIDEYIVSFYIFKNFSILEKENAWLGFGKKREININLQNGDSFKFCTKISKYKNWNDAVLSYVENRIEKNVKLESSSTVFEKSKNALFRSYDHLTGSFLQLPWRDTPGFSLVNFSYSLITYEAVRLHYFAKWFLQTNDEQLRIWSDGLKEIFTNTKLYKTNLKKGKGLVWYNMSNLTKNGLEGYFYMDCGYGGYPGGQSTIAFHLLSYLNLYKDKKLEELVKKSLEYIISTQNDNGSWPMAIRHEGIIRFRSEVLEKYETWGGTGESIRALIEGYKRFNKSSMKNAATKALKYLEDSYPICYNGLRDIGINEPEAFSAVSIIDAFLDAFDLTKNKKYLKNALTYALYTLPWIYFYDTENLKLKYGFHPISFSINPRISPYESVWIVSTYLRLYNVTKDKMWDNLARLVYIEAIKWASDHGGLSEGVFPYYLKELKPLPMEQTFATTELLNASLNFMDIKPRKNYEKLRPDNSKITFKKENDVLRIFYKNIEVFRFNASKCKIEFLKDVNLNDFGISFSFSDEYSFQNKINRYIKSQIRRGRLKFILSIFELGQFLKGVQSPKLNKNVKIKSLENYVKKWDFSIGKDSVFGFWQSNLHKIEYSISVMKKDEGLYISFNPLIVKVLAYDLPIKPVFIPIVGSKYFKKTDNKLFFDNFVLKGNFDDVRLIDNTTVVDQTIKTNWTHGGIFKDNFDIILQIDN